MDTHLNQLIFQPSVVVGRLTDDARRGLTLVELLVVLVVAAIIMVPLGVALTSMARAEQKSVEEARATTEVAPLINTFRDYMQLASADISAGQMALTYGASSESIHFWAPPGATQPLEEVARIWHDPATGLVWGQQLVPAGSQFVLARDVTSCRFEPGPTLSDSPGSGYGDLELASQKCALMTVTVTVGDAQVQHKIVAAGSNID